MGELLLDALLTLSLPPQLASETTRAPAILIVATLEIILSFDMFLAIVML